MKKQLDDELNRIVTQAKRGYITLAECNRLMIDAIENAFSLEYFDSKMKYYHRMYKALFDLTKRN